MPTIESHPHLAHLLLPFVAMRASLLSLLLVPCIASVSAGHLPPLTVKEVGLMLRSGYWSDAVQREAGERHVIGLVDDVAEKALAQAGASPAFLGLLKSGAFAVPPAEITAIKQELAAKARQSAEQAETSRKLDTLYQAKLAQARAATPAPRAATNSIGPLVKGDLVVLKNGLLSPYLDEAFEEKNWSASTSPRIGVDRVGSSRRNW